MRAQGNDEQHRIAGSAALVTVPSGHYGYVPLAGDAAEVDGRVITAVSFALALLCVSVYRVPLLNDVAAMIAALTAVASVVGWRRVRGEAHLSFYTVRGEAARSISAFVPIWCSAALSDRCWQRRSWYGGS